MKKPILLLTFLASLPHLFSQNVERIEIDGKIIAKENDIEGITIFNTSSNKGTITDAQGSFKLEVSLNDRIELSALQFKAVTIIVNDQIVKTKKLTVFLTEQVNTLDEVLLLPNELTGSIVVDIERVELPKPLMIDFGDVKSYEFPIDHLTKVDNTLTKQGQFYNGINFAEILGINKWLNKKPKRLTYEEMDRQYKRKTYDLSQKYNRDFIQKSYNIPEDFMDKFYAYIYANGFEIKLLNYENEMELMEFLLQKSKLFFKEHNLESRIKSNKD